MGRRPTILDVAREAGVSKSTVSLVIQGSPTVKGTTREAVRKAMTKIGYVYNRSAAMLRSSTSGLVGMIINDLRNPFFTEFADSFQTELAKNGFAMVLASSHEDPDLQARMIASLIEHGVSGFIISPVYGGAEQAHAALQQASTPTIQVFRSLEVATPYPLLTPDYQHGGQLATQHLLDMGCKRIGFVGGLDDRPITYERMSGYLDVIRQRGLEPVLLTGEATRAFGRTIAHTLKTDHPDVDGVICFNDLVALGILSGCIEQDVQVGRDLRVVGFDDIEDCRDSYPALSSVSCNIPGFAAHAAKALLKWIKEGEVTRQSERLPVELIVRASSNQPDQLANHSKRT